MWIEIEALPFAYCMPMERTALLLIDMQRDFLEPGGFGASLGNDVTLLRPSVKACARLLELFRAREMPIFYTREAHRQDLSDCPPSKRLRGRQTLRIGDIGPMGRILVSGEVGTEIIPECCPRPGEVVIEKPGKGAFFKTPLSEQLKGREITHLVVGGVTTEVCVQSTLREANDRGYECLLVEDATDSYFPYFKQVTLEMIRAQNAIVGWTASLKALENGLLNTRN